MHRLALCSTRLALARLFFVALTGPAAEPLPELAQPCTARPMVIGLSQSAFVMSLLLILCEIGLASRRVAPSTACHGPYLASARHRSTPTSSPDFCNVALRIEAGNRDVHCSANIGTASSSQV